MLKLNVYCCVVSSARQFKLANRQPGEWLVQYSSKVQVSGRRNVSVKALNGGRDGNTSRFWGQSWEPELEIEVPFEQRPGWSYVGDRLLSAVVPYEETGWYDGQLWVKPPEVLARDRLLGSYKVKPVIKLLKQTLVGTGAVPVASVFLFIFASPTEEFFQSTFTRNASDASTSKTTNMKNLRKEDLLRLPVDVMSDDDLAAAAAEAADGRLVYCRDRFYCALAGGQYCKWDDLVK